MNTVHAFLMQLIKALHAIQMRLLQINILCVKYI